VNLEARRIGIHSWVLG